MEVCRYVSPLGEITLAARQDKLIGLWIEGQKYFAQSVTEEIVDCDAPALRAAKVWLDCYFAGERPDLSSISLQPEGSVFRKLVWELLCEIPYGQVVTYGEIAGKAAGRMRKTRMSAQAAGGAVGHNPISIIIPCHRVVGADGSLTGYGGGIQRKIWLLEHEGVDMSGLYVPRKGTAL